MPPSPDEDALAVMAPPQAAVALAGCGKDVGWQLTQTVLAVQVNGISIIQSSDGLVGIHRDQDGADVCLEEKAERTAK